MNGTPRPTKPPWASSSSRRSRRRRSSCCDEDVMMLSRRHLLTAAGAGLAPLVPGVNVAFGAGGTPTNTIAFLFLRFGMDGLQMLAPADEAGYRDRRPTIALRTSGGGSGIALDTLDGVQFFLHPQALQFREMYKAGTLAFVHAAG